MRVVDRLIRLFAYWRENYYISSLLAPIAKLVHFICDRTATQLQAKVRKNGVSILLPNGKNLKIAKDAGVNIGSLLYWRGIDGYERETSEALRFFFAHSLTFIDVGANCGLYSILAALWNPEIRIVAFEAFQPIYERLKKNIAVNHLNERVLCENIALSSRSGTGVLYIPQSVGNDFETTGTLASESWQVKQQSPSVEVKTMRFDDYARDYSIRVDLVKIDVEDFEADVLEGMYATIQRDRPFIVCEILPRNTTHRNERTRRFVESLNYTPYWITATGYIRVSRFDFDRKHFLDFILSPVSTDAEVIADLTVLLEAERQERERVSRAVNIG